MNIDEIEKLLKEGKVEDALNIVKKEGKGREDDYAEMFLKAGGFKGEFAATMKDEEEYKLALNYFKLAEKLAKNRAFIIELARENQVGTHNNLGNLLKNLKRYKDAEGEYKEAIRINPEDAKSNYNLGVLLNDLKRYEEAEKAYREAIRINPEDAESHNNLGVLLHEKLERYEEAEKAYREAIRINPEYEEAHYNLGLLLKNLKRYKDAEDEYKEAIKINPEDAESHNNLGLLLHEKLERYEEAEKAYREAIRINPEYEVAHYNLGNLLKNLKKYEEAEKEYREGIKINPEDVKSHTNLGSLLADLERPDEAREEYRKAIKLNPKHPGPHNNLGVLLYRQRKYDEAEKEYKKAFELCDDLTFKEIIARNFCILYFKFFERKKIEAHREQLQKIKEFFRETNDEKEFLVDACGSYREVIGYFSSKEHNKAKKKLEEVKVYLKKCDEEQLLELADRTNDLISLDKEFNDLMGLLSTYQKDKSLERISNISNDAKKLSEKGFLIEEFINHYISCVKTFDECFDLFRYEKPIDIDIEKLSKSEDFFVNFGFSVDKNPANSVIRIANKINECSKKINEKPENKKEIIDHYWNVEIKRILPYIVSELNGYAIRNMVDTETQKQTTEVLARIDERTKRIENRVDELLKIAKSTDDTIKYIKESIEKASSENKEILEKLIELTEKYEKTDENLNSINCILTKLISEENTNGLKQIADELTNKENKKKIIDHVKGEENKSMIKGLLNKLKNKVETLPKDVAKEGYKKLVITPITEAIIDILKQGVGKSPEVIPVLFKILIRIAPIILI